MNENSISVSTWLGANEGIFIRNETKDDDKITLVAVCWPVNLPIFRNGNGKCLLDGLHVSMFWHGSSLICEIESVY